MSHFYKSHSFNNFLNLRAAFTENNTQSQNVLGLLRNGLDSILEALILRTLFPI